MNNSGQSIAALMRRISLSLENILVVVDDMSLPFGQTRLRLSGSSGMWTSASILVYIYLFICFMRWPQWIKEHRKSTPFQSICSFKSRD